MYQKLILMRLRSRYEAISSKRTSYSMRAYARDLGMASGALSEIIRQKRRIVKCLALQLVQKLDFTAAEQRDLQTLIEISERAKSPVYSPIDMQGSHQTVVSEWYHFAILHLVETKNFQNDEHWIAQRLAISPVQAREALDRLINLGYLSERNGVLEPSEPFLSTPTDIPSLVLRKTHKRNLELAAESLEKDDVTLRDMTAITMAINSEKLPMAKVMISEFRDKLAEFLEDGNADEVYKLCVQLFPLSRSVARESDDV